jgi:hypothetical protein
MAWVISFGLILAVAVVIGYLGLRKLSSSPPKSVARSATRETEDARQFARLLVSEINLYNRAEVEAGRRSNDIYRRLKSDIDRARELFEARTRLPISTAGDDIFYQELVNVLGEGDPAMIGEGYLPRGTHY